jgi:OmpA-OmpF porin, OOP family
MFARRGSAMRVGWALAAGLAGVAMPALAAQWAQDVDGGKDHALIQRFNDSWLIAYQQLAFDATAFPGQVGLDSSNKFQAVTPVQGRITRLVYFAPLGKTPLEVHRNYEQALASAGFKATLSCTPAVPKCEHMRFPLGDRYNTMKETKFSDSRQRHKEGSPLNEQMRSLGGTNMLGSEDLYFSSGTLTRNGSTVHVMLNTGKVYRTEFTTTYIEIVEPKAMQTGQVTVNADAMGSGLKRDGKIALYGIYFDTGKAEVKPESKAQLDEIAKLLGAQASLKVYLVGHTDNQGSVDANVTLAQRRAQAVAEALVKGYKIDAARLLASGVGSLAPVASNEADEGRARNRRVELVLP